MIDAGYTAVENKFIIDFLPDAPQKCAAVYLLGLTLSDSNGDDNSCATIAAKLDLTETEVLEAFRYWEELGLVTVLEDEPVQILYHTLRNRSGSVKKININKYAKFSDAMQAIITGRMITTAEYKQYYTFLEETTFQPEALLYIAKYCAELKGTSITYPYILTVARNQIVRGATTLATVSDNLNSQQKYDEDLKPVLKALHSNRSIDYNDRVLYEKWTKDYGFTLDTIIAVAKECRTGGMGRLDAKLSEYYRKGALSAKEIADYEEQKTRLFELARSVTKSIGVYYQSLDAVVDEYIVNWLRRGFDEETILAIAKYCFKSGIRTLAGVHSIMDKLYKNGVVDLNSLNGYLSSVAATDSVIQGILSRCGLDRHTTANDRLLFRTWTEDWNMPIDLVEYVADLSAGTASPMAYVNRILSDYKRNGVRSVAQAAEYKQAATVTAATIGGREIERRHYTDEEISALFTVLDETEE